MHVEPRGLYSPHAMSEPGCMTSSSDRHVTDDVMAAGRGGSFDLSEMYHAAAVRGAAECGEGGVVMLGVGVDPQSVMLDHEFSPPSPAPQDALSYTPRSAPFNRYYDFP